MKNNESYNDIEFKGYTIDELRYRRAFALAKYEMAKYQTLDQLKRFQGGFSPSGGIMGKIFSSLNYFDYAMLAFRIGQKIFKWRRSRKK